MKNSNFYAMLARMKYIRRWGLMRSTREENLAEHSLEVATIAHALAVIGNKRLGKSYDAGRLVLCALYHDSAEILTGDLPTPIKYHNAKMKKSYKKIERGATEELLAMLPEDLRAEYAPSVTEELWDEETKLLVKAADKLSALIKCMEEEQAGNREFANARRSIQSSVEQNPLPEVRIFMEEFFAAYGLTLDELR